MKLDPFQILLRPRITEKSNFQEQALNTYTFLVHPKATKQQIKHAVEVAFSVQVADVRTINCRGKWRRTRMGWGQKDATKKALVKLADGQKIEEEA